MVGMLKTTVRRMLKHANLGREWWSYACRFAGHMMREKVLGREWPHPLFGQLVGIWKSHDKAQAKSLDDRGCVPSRHRLLAERNYPHHAGWCCDQGTGTTTSIQQGITSIQLQTSMS